VVGESSNFGEQCIISRVAEVLERKQHGARLLFRDTGRSADPGISIGWLNVQSLHNKTDAVEELVRDRSLDVLALTETWHTDTDDVWSLFLMFIGLAQKKNLPRSSSTN